jgi:hypothetical protein
LDHFECLKVAMPEAVVAEPEEQRNLGFRKVCMHRIL